MVRLKDEAKRRAIRDAVVSEVVSGGLGSVSMSKVSRRAGVAQGTIYLYFEDKEDLIQGVYLDIKRELHSCMMSATKDLSSTEALRVIWYEIFQYVLGRPDDFLFSEFVGAAHILNADVVAKVAKMAGEIGALFEAAIDDGQLIDEPIHLLARIFISPAVHLARSHALAGKTVSKAEMDTTFSLVWKAIAASP